MKKPLDRFSIQAETYKNHRPHYPPDLYDEILQHVNHRQKCWDCGTGNGQVAAELSKHFEQVEATDISENQMKQAPQGDNINYSLQRAENTSFGENQFDLITVAQAVHWFDFDAFNQEVRRVGKNGGIISIWGYALLKVNDQIDELINEFDSDIVGPYWDVERRHIDSYYGTIPFSFEPIVSKKSFTIESHWNIEHLRGYFNSWSCVQNYIEQNEGESPVPALMERLKSVWPDNETKKITFPIFMKMGRVEK